MMFTTGLTTILGAGAITEYYSTGNEIYDVLTFFAALIGLCVPNSVVGLIASKTYESISKKRSENRSRLSKIL